MPYLIAFVGIMLLIVSHEFGHYLAGRLYNVPINEFAIGMGKVVYQTKPDSYGTKWSIRLIPVGGFCAFGGEGYTDDIALEKIPAYQKFIISIAGVTMNFISAYIVTAVALLQRYLSAGTFRFEIWFEKLNTTFSMYFTLLFDSFAMLFDGRASLKDCGTVIGMVDILGSQLKADKDMFVFIIVLCFIAVNLGIVNLLPIVGFDGWKCLEAVFTMISKKHIPDKVCRVLGAISFSFLIWLFVILTFQDILRIFGFTA